MPFVQDVMERSFVTEHVPQLKQFQIQKQCSSCKKFRLQQQEKKKRLNNYQKRLTEKRIKTQSSASQSSNQRESKNIQMIDFVQQFDQLRDKYIELDHDHLQLLQKYNQLDKTYKNTKNQLDIMQSQRIKLLEALQITNQNISCEEIAERYQSDLKQMGKQVDRLCQEIEQNNQILSLKNTEIKELNKKLENFQKNQSKISKRGRSSKAKKQQDFNIQQKNQNQQYTEIKTEEFQQLKKKEQKLIEKQIQIDGLKQIIQNLKNESLIKQRRIKQLERTQQKFMKLKKKHMQFHSTIQKNLQKNRK